MLAFLLTIGILLTQTRMGVLRPGDANAEFWSIAYPYAILLAVWFVFHFTVTAWRLDRERGEREQLPIRLSTSSSRSGNQLWVTIENQGQADEFTVEITGISSWDPEAYPELPALARCSGGQGKTPPGVVRIPERGSAIIELAKHRGRKSRAPLVHFRLSR